MGDDITIGVTEIVNNIEVTAQPNDQIVDISVIDNADDVTLNITPTVIEINVNKGSSYAKWGTILGTLSDQTDLQNALDLKADLVDGKVPSSQLPSYVDDVIEVANYASLPVTGETGKIYITLDNNKVYRWSGSVYIEIAANNAVWGAITGTLSNQTDLQSALNAKVPYSGATSNVNLGEYGLTGGFLALDTTPTSTPTGIGTIYWDSANRTAALIDGDGDTTLQIGQEQRILVHNNTGSTLTDGQVVYVTGSTGNLPSVALASATIESTSAATIGVVTESIANGADGFITTSGIVNGLNTLAFNEGDLLWLGTTAGTFSTTKPISPNHLVLIGYVIKKAGGNGSILVKIQNTQELDECSDVLFSGLANNDLLVYETASALWKNKSLATVLGYTPVSPTRTISTTSPLQGGGDLSADRTLSITQANTSTNGYLSSTDWNTFNNKQNALGYTPANDTNVVHKTGNESIAGWKTFTGGITLWDNSSNNLLDFFISGTEVGSISVGSSFFQFKALNSNGYLFQNNSGSNSLTISNSGNGTFLGSVTASSIIKSGGTSSQFLKADGSVDSNTYATTSQLHDAVTIGTANGLSLSTQVLSLGLASSSTNGALSSTDWNTFNNKQNALTNPITGTGTTNYLSKFTGSGTLGNSSIYDNGNIGIGTTSPVEKLQVLGNIRLTNNNLITSNTLSSEINNYNGSSNQFKSSSIKFLTGTYVDQGHITFNTSISGVDQERVRIAETGNVGIGTTSPTHLLSVENSSSYETASFKSSSVPYQIIGNAAVGDYWRGFFTGQNIVTNTTTGKPSIRTSGFTASAIAYSADSSQGYLGFFTTSSTTANTDLSERMRITSAGNVGIGTTAPTFKLHNVGDTFSTNYLMNRGGGLWNIIPSSGANELYFKEETGGNVRMTILGSGNVGIGTTSPDRKLTVNSDLPIRLEANSNPSGYYTLLGTNYDYDKSFLINNKGDEILTYSQNESFGLSLSNPRAGNIRFSTNGSERMRITSGGNVGIGTTSPSSKLDVVGSSWVSNLIANDAVGNSIFIRFNTSVTSNIGSITRAGSTSAVLYNTTSDYRLKEDFKNYSGLDLISNIKTYDFKWKNSEDRMYGVIAHELQEVVPYAVNGEKDAEQMQQVDYSKLVPILVEAIKELKAEIEILKNK